VVACGVTVAGERSSRAEAVETPSAEGSAGGGEAQPAHGAPHLPSLFRADSMTEVEGKILRSTRGHPGMVRLEVARDGGGKLNVLLAPDKVLDALAVSMRAGERIDATGSLVAGQNPILVAAEVRVDRRHVRLRDDQGKLVAPPRSTAGATPTTTPARAATTAGSK